MSQNMVLGSRRMSLLAHSGRTIKEEMIDREEVSKENSKEEDTGL